MNLAKEKEENERSKGKEVKETHHHHHARASGDCLDRTLCGIGSKCWNLGITPLMLVEAADKIGMNDDEVNDWLKYMDEVGWTFNNGNAVTARNFRRPLRMWHKMKCRVEASQSCGMGRIDQLREDGLKRQRQAAQSRRESESCKPESWELCRERCAMYNGGDDARCGFCRAGFRTPPQLRDRPCPPEECPRFAAFDGEVVA